MKVLVGIASYGTKNDKYLSILIKEYKSMKYDVDIVVFSNIPRAMDKGIEVIVGLPSENPWSLPFTHKSVFAERVDTYDLFIYTENDILIKERNIDAFLRMTSFLPRDEIAGFMLYEDDPLNKKNHVDVHGSFHWDPKSVKTIGDYTFAHFTNEHSACYLLTREQLKKAIASGGYLTLPYEGKYDLLCTAATDPYTQCGFTKVICVSHFEDFELHHLPNAYVGEFGISQSEFDRQLEALLEVARGNRPRTELLERMRLSRPVKRSKWYYEPRDHTVLSLVFQDAKSVLSIGCGSAETESKIIEKGIKCVCIPLDSVIGAVAEMKGVSTLYPDFDSALSNLDDECVDCILMLNILQHVDDPSDLLAKCGRVLSPRGIIIGTIPNASCVEDFLPKRYKKSMGSDRVRFYRIRDIVQSGIRIIVNKISEHVRGRSLFEKGNKASDVSRESVTTKRGLELWLKRNGIKVTKIDYVTDNLSLKRRRITVGPFKFLLADKLIFVGRKGN